MKFSLGEPFEVSVIHRHDLPSTVIGLAPHLKLKGIFGLRVGQGHQGLIPLGVDLGHGGGRSDYQNLGVVQIEQVAFNHPPYLGLEGLQ